MFQKFIAIFFFLIILVVSTVSFFTVALQFNKKSIITVDKLPIDEFGEGDAISMNFESVDGNNEEESYQFFQGNIMEHLLRDLKFKWLKNAIVLNQEFYNDDSNESITYEHWQFEPHKFQKIFLKIIAEKIDFMNLALEFRYYEDYKRVAVKVTDQDNEENVIFKQYSITVPQ